MLALFGPFFLLVRSDSLAYFLSEIVISFDKHYLDISRCSLPPPESMFPLENRSSFNIEYLLSRGERGINRQECQATSFEVGIAEGFWHFTWGKIRACSTRNVRAHPGIWQIRKVMGRNTPQA